MKVFARVTGALKEVPLAVRNAEVVGGSAGRFGGTERVNLREWVRSGRERRREGRMEREKRCIVID